MTPAAFVAKWRVNTRNERAAAQEHFLDLCALLNEATPNSDPTGAAYAFEKGASKASGGEGWADVWRRGRFAWEYKGKHKDLDAAHRQLLQYAGALENPPLLVTSDIERITIRTNWTNAVSERHEVRLDELTDPARLALLKSVFADPERLRPGKTRAALTAEAAAEFAELAGRLRDRGHDAQEVAHFVNRLVFCLFADDVDLLPPGLFERMLDAARKRPGQFEFYARRLFAAMAERGGEVDFTPVAWFNGGLFDTDAALPLEANDIVLLQRAAALDWAEIDPSILGTLFERGLDPSKRSQLGAHYTSREMIERLIEPVIRRPLLKGWRATKAQIEAILATSRDAKPGSRMRRDGPTRATSLFRAFLDRLRAFRVLDPACGSGNFLYLALLALKDLEHQTMVEAEALGLQREFPQVGPEAMLGLEINPYAAELARVSVWIGHIQWARRHGYPAPSDPVLRSLDTIECRDAVLTAAGTPAAWPAADVIVGNPPFLGNKSMIGTLGEDYTTKLRAAYEGRLTGAVEFVCYWFEKSREEVEAGLVERVGLVATQSIRKGASRAVLDRIRQCANIYDAWGDEEWTVDGADVRVSLICFAREHNGEIYLNGRTVPAIHADLSAGAVDITTAHRLAANLKLSFQGPVVIGRFDVPGETARKWLRAPRNANGKSNASVVRPYVNGQDLTKKRSPDIWLIDFAEMEEVDAAYFSLPFAHAMREVKPQRDKNRRPRRRLRWWQHGETVPGLRAAVLPFKRYIATPRVSRHRVFVWLDVSVMPDSRLYAIARDDDTAFGILHSKFHAAWALAQASRHGVGNDPTYNNQTCFETFPFPHGLTLDLPATDYVDDLRAKAVADAARNLVAARDRWLYPDDLIEWIPEVIAGFPARPVPRSTVAARELKDRTLTNLYSARGKPEGAWLDALHRTLDAAVAAAYGWLDDIADDEVLARLLALNHAREPA